MIFICTKFVPLFSLTLCLAMLESLTQVNATRQKKEEAADSSALSGEQRHIKCKDTFLDILNGAISESLEPIPRFYFVSPTRVLFVWVMDRELQGFY